MADENDDKAQALIASLSDKMVATILPKITESVEEQIRGIASKNEELLGKLSEQKDHTEKLAELLASAAEGNPPKQSSTFTRGSTKPIQIKRSDARDPATYRAAKAQAEKDGVSLEIVADD